MKRGLALTCGLALLLQVTAANASDALQPYRWRDQATLAQILPLPNGDYLGLGNFWPDAETRLPYLMKKSANHTALWGFVLNDAAAQLSRPYVLAEAPRMGCVFEARSGETNGFWDRPICQLHVVSAEGEDKGMLSIPSEVRTVLPIANGLLIGMDMGGTSCVSFVNREGQMQWRYDMPDTTFYKLLVVQEATNGYAICAFTRSQTYEPRIVLQRFDVSGALLWEYVLAQTDSVWVWDMLIDSEGAIALVANDVDADASGILWRIADNGILLWRHEFSARTGSVSLHSVLPSQDGYCIWGNVATDYSKELTCSIHVDYDGTMRSTDYWAISGYKALAVIHAIHNAEGNPFIYGNAIRADGSESEIPVSYFAPTSVLQRMEGPTMSVR